MVTSRLGGDRETHYFGGSTSHYFSGSQFWGVPESLVAFGFSGCGIG